MLGRREHSCTYVPALYMCTCTQVYTCAHVHVCTHVGVFAALPSSVCARYVSKYMDYMDVEGLGGFKMASCT